MAKFGIEVKWGFIFLCFTLVWMLAEKLLGLHSTHIDKHAFYTNFFIIPVILIYILALLEKRNNYFSGSISWSQGAKSGIVLSMVITFLSPLSQVIIHKIISPEYFSNVIKFAIDTGSLSQPDSESYFSLKSYIVQSMFGSFVVGIFLSLGISLFIKSKPQIQS